MNAVDFFQSDALRLPIRRDKERDGDFEAFLDRVFRNYIAQFDNLTSTDALTQLIKEGKHDAQQACEHIQVAVHEYLCGWPLDALSKLRYALGAVQKHFEHLMPKSDQSGWDFLSLLFRLRTESPQAGIRGVEFGRHGMFHIPYDRREIVARQRYSIPGLPSLYLGSSVYVCWEELGRPPFHSVYASAFQVRKGETITVLDLTETPAATARSISREDFDFAVQMLPVVARAICWPLQAACSICRLHREAPFIAEYIVPQLLLQWVTDSNRGRTSDYCKVDGIGYFSVNCEQAPHCPSAYLNFVFPAQEIQAKGHCPVLKEKFELTEAASWQLLENSWVGNARTTRNAPALIPLAGRNIAYLTSPFGPIESKLILLPFERLK